ncbi:heterokaryon incompatibility protein-domain-containing protein [Cerioporus squamosus]|nr:heterokaryon incompatibility protein-domain-containing protein [Cerioporus squamosus]
MAHTVNPLKSFSLCDTIQACAGAEDYGELEDRPLRVLASTAPGASYELVPYTGEPYVAISYCWPSHDFERIGVSNNPTQIVTPGGVIHSEHFSQFMARAIEVHRAEIGVRAAVWIDTHCINQSDEEEKRAQVAILHRIYSHAQTTLIVLEDIALTADEQRALTRFRISQETVALVRRVTSARWVHPCLVLAGALLSTRTVFFVHDASSPGNAILVPAETLWHLMDAARHYDRSIPLFTLFEKNMAYALNIVYKLGCSDEYDKISLVCNLMRFTYRFTSRPSAFGANAQSLSTLRVNVLKMAMEYSMLLATQPGFGWAGVPVAGDRISEIWAAKDYEEYTWVIHRDAGGLHVTVDTQTAGEQAGSDIELHARVAIAYLLAEPDYQYQPEPMSGDPRALLQDVLGEAVGRLRDIASAMKFVWRTEDRASFSTILLSEGSILLVSGNATDLPGGLSGKTLFQPFVVRPKLFSTPMVLTANSMVLEGSLLPDGTHRCVGCVRGLGMISETHLGAEQQLRII